MAQMLTSAVIWWCLIAIVLSKTICPPDLEKFVDPLPIPRVLAPIGYDNYPIYSINITQKAQKLHRDLPMTQMWVFEGTFPGPTIEVESNQKVHVNFMNNLPIDNPLLPQLDLGMTNPQDRVVVHLHGGLSKPQYCGHPLDFVRPLPGANNYTNYYGNQQPATLLWYHDHSMQTTPANVYAGLAGIYIIRDEFERSLHLPSGQYEVPLILTDKNLNLNTGQLILEFNRTFTGGTHNLVNGKVWPYQAVQPAKYRLRILNASNHRMFNLYFDNGMTFNVIGADQGFLKNSVTVKKLFIAPAERFDVIVDFTNYKSKRIVLKTDAPFIYPIGQNVSDCDSAIIMQFRVGKLEVYTGDVPTDMLTTYEIPQDTPDVRHRTFFLDAITSPVHGLQFLINDSPFLSRLVASVPLGTTEIWEFVNNMRSAHPIHIHAVEFRVIDRRPFNATLFSATKQVQYTGPPVPALLQERGYKDTVLLGAYESARIITVFGPYPGEYIMHCHILEHEDNDMMRRFAITPVGPDCEWDEFQKDESCTYFD